MVRRQKAIVRVCEKLNLPWRLPLALFLALISVGLFSDLVRHTVLAGYPGDSAYTLPVAGQSGLALLSLLLAVGLARLQVGLSLRLAQSRVGQWRFLLHLSIDLGLVALLCWLALSIAPQIYYGYYLVLFDGLPLQAVARPLSGEQFLSLVLLEGKSSLSHHLQGLLVRALGLLVISIHLLGHLGAALNKDTADKG